MAICRGDFGRLGHGNSSDLFIPQPIKALDGVKIKQIACGDSHCLAVSMDGSVVRLVAHFSLCFLFLCGFIQIGLVCAISHKISNLSFLSL